MPNWTIWILLLVLIAVYFLLRRTTPSRRKRRDFNMPPTYKAVDPPPPIDSGYNEKSPKEKPNKTETNDTAEREEDDSGASLDDLESELEGFLGGETEKSVEPDFADPTRGGPETTGGPPPPPPPHPPQSKQEDKVTFGVFTSEGIEAGKAFVLDVWAYLMKDFTSVTQMAKMMNRDAAVGMKAGVNISRGTVLTLQVEINDMTVQDPVQSMVWDGDPVNCSFIANPPQELSTSTYPGKVTISSHGIPFATISFAVNVVGSSVEEPVKISGAPRYPASAFASYASKNRDEVLGRIHGMMQVAPEMDVFLDALTLRSGQNWADQLVTNILSREIFYLFWSPEAAASEWVEQEWKLALEKKGIQFINPVPLADPRDAPPPAELGSLHFNDAHVAMIQYERMRKQLNS